MKFTIANLVFSVTRKPRLKHDYTALHAFIKTIAVGGEDHLPHIAHQGRCALADALVKGARRNGVKVKSKHTDGQLVVRRVA